MGRAYGSTDGIIKDSLRPTLFDRRWRRETSNFQRRPSASSTPFSKRHHFRPRTSVGCNLLSGVHTRRCSCRQQPRLFRQASAGSHGNAGVLCLPLDRHVKRRYGAAVRVAKPAASTAISPACTTVSISVPASLLPRSPTLATEVTMNRSLANNCGRIAAYQIRALRIDRSLVMRRSVEQ